MNNRVFEEYDYDDMNMLNEMILSKPINNDLVGTYDGYLKGNMFSSLYNQYKDYKPAKLIPSNEQSELLLNANQACFAAHDIRLYLDINPNNNEMIKLYNNYQMQAIKTIKEYEKKYGPILADSPSEEGNFSWEAHDFPWEKGVN